MAASTDPFLSLVLGFGTAYPPAGGGVLAPAVPLDFIVTALGTRARRQVGAGGLRRGHCGAGGRTGTTTARQYVHRDRRCAAAARRRRQLALDLADRLGPSAHHPAFPHRDLGGDARQHHTPARPSGGYRPIAINQAADPPDPEFYHLNMVDREIPIPSNPGACQLTYAVAVQDIYGQWTPWISVAQSLAARPRAGSARERDVDAGRARKRIGLRHVARHEFLWDWRIRTPQQITFVARMYAAATYGTPPPSLVRRASIARSRAAVRPWSSPSAARSRRRPGATIISLTRRREQRRQLRRCARQRYATLPAHALGSVARLRLDRIHRSCDLGERTGADRAASG